MMRQALTLIFAALPAMVFAPLLFLFSGIVLEHFNKGRLFEGLLLGTICLFVLLGIIGLFAVSLQRNYKTVLNLVLISCGTIVMAIFYIGGIFTQPSWYLPSGFNKDTYELIMMTSLFGFGVFYTYQIARGLVNKTIKTDVAEERRPAAY
jgi:uncharacterized membrane protein